MVSGNLAAENPAIMVALDAPPTYSAAIQVDTPAVLSVENEHYDAGANENVEQATPQEAEGQSFRRLDRNGNVRHPEEEMETIELHEL